MYKYNFSVYSIVILILYSFLSDLLYPIQTTKVSGSTMTGQFSIENISSKFPDGEGSYDNDYTSELQSDQEAIKG